MASTTHRRGISWTKVQAGLLAIVGVLVVVTYWLGDSRNDRQDDAQLAAVVCLEKRMGEHFRVLAQRAVLADRDSKNVNRVILAATQADPDVDPSPIRRALKRYAAKHEKIVKARAETPVPVLPPGTCTK